jgi:hypothetical protein
MMDIDPAAVQAFQSLALGFALAGFIATGFEVTTARRASFQLLEEGGPAALASVPVVVFSAPFILLRNTVTRGRHEKTSIAPVMLTTVLACFWSLMCGRVALDLVAILF